MTTFVCLPLNNQLISESTLVLKVLPNSSEPLGVEVLKSRGFFTNAYWYWIGVGALVGFTLLYNLCFTLALTFLGRAYLYLVQFIIPDSNVFFFPLNIVNHVMQHCRSLKLLYLKTLQVMNQEVTTKHLQVIKLILNVCSMVRIYAMPICCLLKFS